MRFDKIFHLTERVEVPDGMGGWEVHENEKVGEIWTFTTPVTAEIMLKDYGVVSTHAMKIFTKDDVPNEHVQLMDHDDNKYKILQLADYGKFKMLLVEVVEHA